MRASFGWTTSPGRVARTDDERRAATAPAAAMTVRRGRAQSARPTPSAAFVSASTTTMAGDPMRRHEDERDDEAADDRAGRVHAEQQPGLRTGRAASSRSSSDAVGKARPITKVTGRTVSTAAPNRTPTDSSGWLAIQRARLRDHEDQPGHAEDRHGDLRDRQDPDRVLDPRAEHVVASRPRARCRSRNSARMTVKT